MLEISYLTCVKYPTLMLRIQHGLPVSTAAASTLQAKYWPYAASGGFAKNYRFRGYLGSQKEGK